GRTDRRRSICGKRVEPLSGGDECWPLRGTVTQWPEVHSIDILRTELPHSPDCDARILRTYLEISSCEVHANWSSRCPVVRLVFAKRARKWRVGVVQDGLDQSWLNYVAGDEWDHCRELGGGHSCSLDAQTNLVVGRDQQLIEPVRDSVHLPRGRHREDC